MKESVTYMSDINIQFELVGDESWIVRPRGALDFASGEAFQKKLDHFLAKNPKSILFDMQDVHYLSSTGLGVLLNVYKLTHPTQTPVIFYDLQKSVRRVMEIAKLEFMMLDPQKFDERFANFRMYIEREEPKRSERRSKEAKKEKPPRLFS